MKTIRAARRLPLLAALRPALGPRRDAHAGRPSAPWRSEGFAEDLEPADRVPAALPRTAFAPRLLDLLGRPFVALL